MPVEPASVQAGVKLALWFANQDRRIYAMLSESTEERDTRRLIEFIQAREGRITVRALQKSNSRKYPNAGYAETALEGLVNAGLAEWQNEPAGARGGRPSKVCVLRPTTDTTDTTLNSL